MIIFQKLQVFFFFFFFFFSFCIPFFSPLCSFSFILEELHLEIQEVDVSDCLKKTVEGEGGMGEKVEEGWLHSEKLIFLKKK